MLKKSHYIVLAIAVLAVLALLEMPGGSVGKMKLAISGLFLPLFGLSTSAHELASRGSSELLPKRELIRQLEELRHDKQELQIRLSQEAQIRAENARLRSALGWQQQKGWRVKLARVISRDPANFWRTLEIDLGANDGIKANLPVLTADGLVGRVQNVGATRSQVIMLGDPNLKVSAVVSTGTTNREMGIIGAITSAPREDGMIDLDHLSGASTVGAGQSVETSGVGGIFPPGIHIGKVVDVQTNDYGLSIEARVKLAADLGSLEELWVKMP